MALAAGMQIGVPNVSPTSEEVGHPGTSEEVGHPGTSEEVGHPGEVGHPSGDDLSNQP